MCEGTFGDYKGCIRCDQLKAELAAAKAMLAKFASVADLFPRDRYLCDTIYGDKRGEFCGVCFRCLLHKAAGRKEGGE
jgi:hypothetical protein